MLKILDQQHYDAVEAFAKEKGGVIEESFRSKIKYLTEFGCRTQDGVNPSLCEVHLGKDFAPHSFIWAAYRAGEDRCFYNGGMIYHGPGAGETYSVVVEPVCGWSIHS